MRRLHLFAGSTALASAAVTAAFMAGLACGAAAAARRGDRAARPLRLYGLLEVGIGLYALALPALLTALVPLYRVGANALSESPLAVNGLRFVVAFVALVAPTTAMGATLPLLVRHLTAGRRSTELTAGGTAAGAVSALYSANTAGALAGTLGAGFFLLPRIGETLTTACAAGLDLVVGLGALALSTRAAPLPPTAAGSAPAAAVPRGSVRAVLAALALSGAGAMACQIAWTRWLAMLLGSSVYAFTVIVATVLAGISLGSGLAGRLPRALAARPLAALAAAEGLAALAALAGAGAGNWLPWAAASLVRAAGADALVWAQAGLSATVVLLPSVLLGMALPLAIRALAPDASVAGGWVGRAYTANTVGAIAGAAAGGIALLPLLGIRGTLLAGAFLAGAAGSLAGAATPVSTHRRGFRALLPLAPALLVAGLIPRWEPALMVTQPYLAIHWEQKGPYEQFRARVLDPVHRVLSHREGATTTVTVVEDLWQAVLKVDGKADASSVTDMPTQVLLAHVPFLLAPGPDGPREALVIGWGSGVSPGSAALHPGARVTAVEIEPEVVEGARAFDHVSHRPLGRENVRVVFEDARTYLLGRSALYDVILSEPSNPWLSGPAKLFTEDFFRIVKSRLRPGGVFGQWVQMYGLAPEHLQAILRTFREVFPDVRVFVTIEDADLLFLGGNGGGSGTGPVDLARIAARADAPGVREDLARVSAAGWSGVLSRYVGGPAEVAAYAGEGPRNTDDNGLVEFGAPWTLLREALRERLVDEVASIECDPLALLGPEPPGGPAAALAALARAAAGRGDWARAARFARRSLGHGETAEARMALAESFAARGESLHATSEMERALALAPGLVEARERLAEWLLRGGDAAPALAALEAAPEETPGLRTYRAVALSRAGRALEALEAFRGVPEEILRDGRNAIPDARLERARARLASGDPAGSLEDYEGFLRDFPARMEVLAEAGEAYRDAGRWEDLKRVEASVASHEQFQREVLPDLERFPETTEEGLRVRRRAFELHPQDAENAANLVRALRQRGAIAEALGVGRRALDVHAGFLELATAHAGLLEVEAGKDPARAPALLSEARDALRRLLERNRSLDTLRRAEIGGRIARIEGKLGAGR